ncbi:MAG: ROK family protein [Hyphomicrobiales bacterium]|nr:ROK family protein [Hyphomicrobiales bacterium]
MSPRVAIGVDVGGSKIAGALVDLDSGRILTSRQIATGASDGGAEVFQRLSIIIDEIFQDADEKSWPVIGTGIGVPELVNLNGAVKSTWNFDLGDIDLQHDLDICKTRAVEVRVESDVRAAALAELQFGLGQDYESFVYVSIGTGLSFAFASNGRLHRGANGYAIHFASSPLETVCAGCGQQHPFVLEDMAGGAGLTRTVHRLSGAEASVGDILNGAAGVCGDKVRDQAARALASYIGQLVNIFDPHSVILGGGLGTAPAYSDRIVERVPDYIWAPDCRSLPLLRSKFGADTGAIGAAALWA